MGDGLDTLILGDAVLQAPLLKDNFNGIFIPLTGTMFHSMESFHSMKLSSALNR
jgi:hypothetical protein